MNMSQRGLSRRLGVDPSMLSRFLSQQPGYEPGPKRPRILKLLEDIEQFCTQVEDVSLWQEDGVFDEEDDVRVWARAHTLRLRALRQMSIPGEALVRVSELSAQALCFPPAYRPYVCINTELAISVAMYKEFEARSSTEGLIRGSVRRVDALEQAALVGIRDLSLDEAGIDEQTGRAKGFAAVVRAYAGLRIEDASLVRIGADGLIEAAQHPCPPAARLWHNLLRFVDLALRLGTDGVDDWSRRAADLAMRSRGSEALSLALADQSVSRLRSHWIELGVDLAGGSGE